jgi:hypothetical protein
MYHRMKKIILSRMYGVPDAPATLLSQSAMAETLAVIYNNNNTGA